jgi:hypothetical protein
MSKKKKSINKKISNLTKQSNRAASLNLHRKNLRKGEVFKMAKIGTQKQVEIEGVVYTLQYPGARERMRIQDRAQLEGGRMSSEKLAEELFKHVIVDPKVSWDYFDGNDEKGIEPHEGLDELLEEAMNFLKSGR